MIDSINDSNKMVISNSCNNNQVVNSNINDTIPKRKVLNDYSLVKFLGKGSFGSVWKAKHVHPPYQFVALKIVARSRLSVEYMRKEKNILESLIHPNIVRYIDYYEDKKNYYLLEELVDAGDLFDVLSRQHKYNEHDAKILALQLIKAVQYIHEKGIVHRDIKCENTLCTIGPDGSITLKITDFGHAENLPEAHEGLLQQFDVGSPCYRPPEFIERRAYGKSCDIFSVGVVIYILLVGQYPYYPYDRYFVHKVVNRIHLCASGNEKMSNFWASISIQAQSFLLKLLEYHEERRPTATEALHDKWFIGDNQSSSNNDIDNNVFNFCDLSDSLIEIRKQLARRKLITTVRTLMKFSTSSFRKRKNRVNNNPDENVNEKKKKEETTDSR